MNKINLHVAYKTRLVTNILDFLKEGHMSEEDYDSAQMPFFMKDKTNEFKVNNKDIPQSPEGLNRNIKLMYELFGNPDIEVYIRDWTFLSLNKAIEVYNDYVNNNLTKVFDIGFQYAGMGHIVVLSCDLDNHLLFKRRDGGSNDYDREVNYKNLLKLHNVGWNILTRRWGFFFIVMALLNEIIWRNFSTDFWVSFKVFGFLPITIIFTFLQQSLIKKYSIK